MKVRDAPGRLRAAARGIYQRVGGRPGGGGAAGGVRVFEVAVGARRAALLELVRAELALRGIGFTEGGAVKEWRPKFHLRYDDIAAAVDALRATLTGLTGTDPAVVLFRVPGAGFTPLDRVESAIGEAKRPAVDLWFRESGLGGPDLGGERLFAVAELDFWRMPELTYRERPYINSPRSNTFASTMPPTEFDRLLGYGPAPRQLSLEEGELAPDLYSRDFPIDVVYTWVDDSDPRWAAQRASHRPSGRLSESEARGDLDERFRNRDELRYSLRSIDMFAPFVRKIYLVTMDQCPDWLDTTDPRIDVVSHRDIYRHPDALPTFNSSSIETQLHHIDGLSEHFIYFNDDVFLGRPCSWSDFFLGNGAAKFFFADHTIAASVIPDGSEEYLLADRNAIDLLRREFGYVVHHPMAHVPHAARRSVLEELESRFAPEFEACERARFRSAADLRPIAFMGHHHGFATGRAVPGVIDQRYLALWKPYIDQHLDEALRTRRHQTLCLNDVGVEPGREAEVDRLVHRFLDGYFPVPSAFEKSRQRA